jgi:hypothetical protein
VNIPFGTELFGELRTPAGMVSTKYFHIAHMPLIPLGSYIVQDEYRDGFVGARIGLNPGSLALGYFRRWGFVAALGLAAWSAYMFDRSTVPWSTLVMVPVGAMLLVASTIASWYAFGAERTPGHWGSFARWAGIPVAVMLAASIYLWTDRASYEAMAARSRAEAAAKQQAELKHQRETALSPGEENRLAALNKFAVAVTKAFNEQSDPWPTKKCDDDLIRKTATSSTARELVVGEYAFLVNHKTRPKTLVERGWVMTPAIAALHLADKKAMPTLATLEDRPYWAVILTEDATTKSGKWELTGWLGIHDATSGKMICSTRLEVDSTAGAGAVPPPAAIQDAFKDKARKKLAAISKELRIYSGDQLAKH